MIKKWFSLVVLTAIIAALAACGKDEVQPRAVNEETDTCEICNMAVVDNQHATQIVLENGKSLMFDDIGCMYEWLDENGTEEVAGEFVRDYQDKEWVEVKDAAFVYNKSVKTPMAYNVISFKDKSSAEEFSKENDGSTVMTESDLDEHSWEANHDMMDMEGSEGHSHGSEGHSHDEDTDSSDSH